MKLGDFKNISENEIELLEVAGFTDAVDFLDFNSEALTAELAKANSVLNILSEAPSIEKVKEWQAQALSVLPDSVLPDKEETVEAEPDRSEESELDKSKEIYQGYLDQLKEAPEADLLSPVLIKENELSLSDIPKGLLLNDNKLGPDHAREITDPVRKSVAGLPTTEVAAISAVSVIATPDAEKQAVVKKELPVNADFRDFNKVETDGYTVQPLERGPSKSVVAVSENLNKGVSPTSRRYIKGVLHPNSGQIIMGAIVTVCMQLLFIGTLAALALLVYEAAVLSKFNYYPIAIVGGLFCCSLFLYLTVGLKAKCCVCTQREFGPKSCAKHKKAHRVFLIGYIFPTALHALLFKWFYCIYCGTAIRLKK